MISIKIGFISAVMLMFVSSKAAGGQNQIVPRIVATDVHEVGNPQRWGTLALPVKCDTDGNLYLHERQLRGGSIVVRVSPDASRVTKFDFDSLLGAKNAWVSDFSVDENGEVVGLIESKETYSVAHVSKDVKLSDQDDLAASPAINLRQTVALHGGSVFVSGTETGKENPKNSGKPYNAIYGPDGKLVKRLIFPGDAGAGGETTPDATGNSNSAVSLGSALAGDDGNFYVLRLSSPALVYVVSQSGKFVRKFTVTEPMKGGKAFSFVASRSHLAVVFDSSDSRDASSGRIRVVDSDGRLISDYQLSKELGEILGCYVGNTFTFWRSDAGLLQIVEASPQ